jgi:hypothetical protein
MPCVYPSVHPPASKHHLRYALILPHYKRNQPCTFFCRILTRALVRNRLLDNADDGFVLAKTLCLLISESPILFVNFTFGTQLLASPVEIGMLNVVTLLMSNCVAVML